MNRCFVIQPFDGGDFDNRFEDIFAPAIKQAGLEPYRVDRDPKVSIPIHDIEQGIKDSRLCLADISLDNPNVWFELGFAIGSNKEVVLVCSDHRAERFPFDVQHRSIIKYSTGSPRDFENLKLSIAARIKAMLQKEETISTATDISKLHKIEGLDQHEVVTLATIGENVNSSDDVASIWDIRRDMERSGFTNLATSLALRTLAQKNLVEVHNYNDDGEGELTGYLLTDLGWSWILDNKHQFILKKPKKTIDDIPF